MFPAKTNGLIVDYVGVFRDLQKALAIYAAPGAGGTPPVQDKDELIELLRACLAETVAFCRSKGVDLDRLTQVTGFELIQADDAVVELLLIDEETKTAFLSQARLVDRLYKAILPDPVANEFSGTCGSAALPGEEDRVSQSAGGRRWRAGPGGATARRLSRRQRLRHPRS